MTSIPQKPITCVTPGNAMLVSIEICLTEAGRIGRVEINFFFLLKCNYRVMMRKDG